MFPRGARPLLVTLLLGSALPAADAQAKTPWEELMGRKPKLWHDPEGRFQIDLPVGWEAEKEPEGRFLRFVRVQQQTGLIAELQVEIRSLPPDVRASHLDAHVQRNNETIAPGYKVHDRRKLKVSGTEAIQTLFTYRARGNAQMGREVVQTVFVVGDDGYILTFETLLGGREGFRDELEIMFEGFTVNGVVAPSTPRRASTAAPRRKVRAGEMINPDAVGY